jgi:ribosome biogenesis GTPase A
MTKAMRMMEENIALVDGVLYVLDARCPVSSYNPKLKKMCGEKPILYILNKSDLADNTCDAFIKLFASKGEKAVKATSTGTSSRRAILNAIDELTRAKREQNAAKGYNKVFRFMVVGVPNTGKSTVINLLCGNKRAQTGDKAGVTRAKQWVRCETFELLDTPGTMPPAFENQTFAARLAFVGSINDDILDYDDLALALLEELAKTYPERLTERYKIQFPATPLEMLDAVCKARGFVMRGGEYDYERGERALIDDFRKSRLGPLTLDSPSDFSTFDY